VRVFTAVRLGIVRLVDDRSKAIESGKIDSKCRLSQYADKHQLMNAKITARLFLVDGTTHIAKIAARMLMQIQYLLRNMGYPNLHPSLTLNKHGDFVVVVLQVKP
jgi:hypothetical protein